MATYSDMCIDIRSRDIICVQAIRTPKGWRYVAAMKDGSDIVLRKAATRLYTNVYIYDDGSRPTFGVQPDRWAAKRSAYVIFPITVRSS